MKKRVSLAVLLGLILALLAEAILTLLQAFQKGRIRFRGPRHSWIPLPLAAANPTPLSIQRTTTAGEGSRFGASPPRRASHPQPATPLARPRPRSRASAGS